MVVSADEATPIARTLARLLNAATDVAAANAVRSLFVEELDFHPAQGLVPLHKPELPQNATRIASRDGVHVVMVRMPTTGALRVLDIRVVVRGVQAELGNDILLVAGNVDGSEWQLVYPAYRSSGEMLRRMVLHRGHAHRTVVEQLAKVYGWAEHGDLRDALDRAYDVEAVTKAFFQEYKRVFDTVMGMVEGFVDSDDLRLFCQTLFNRLMFIYFLQRKGWLTVNGDSDYLHALWRDSSRLDENFYEVRLKLLFFVGLNSPRDADFDQARSLLRGQIGDVPFLNGGLFSESDLDRHHDVRVPNEAIALILNDLFKRFNFTITESTPYDVQVAVDPEMLGKVFEELVTGRHETGSYYTPRPIVSFMCRQALKGYLRTYIKNISPNSLENYIDERDVTGLDRGQAEEILDALERITVVDPACGSGAYLLGMMQELLECENSLYNPKLVKNAKNQYDIKLRIIERNVYGVDIDPIAVNIAMLRLWLSLIVDFEGGQPPPLPNLDFKIACGDSLCGEDPQNYQTSLQVGNLAHELEHFKGQYIRATGETKNELYRSIELRIHEIQEIQQRQTPSHGIDWRLQFSEVFEHGGFHIVVANPPYVRQELMGHLKPKLKAVYGPRFAAMADLYVFFYYRAIQLLRARGMVAFISSNKWLQTNYGAKLRSYLSAETAIHMLVDFGDLPVFQSATAYPIILVAEKQGLDEVTRYVQVRSLLDPYPHIDALVQRFGKTLTSRSFRGSDWVLTSPQVAEVLFRMETKGVPLAVYARGKMYRGILTGFNTAFYIDEALRSSLIKADPKSAELIHPFLAGRDIRRWSPEYEPRWLIAALRGVDIARYPAIEAHLAQWKDQLTPKDKGGKSDVVGRKPGTYKWYEIQDDTKYFAVFERAKIVYQRFQVKPCFSFEERGSVVNDAVYFIAVDDAYLLAVLNSVPFWTQIQRYCTRIQNGFQLLQDYLERCTIPLPSDRMRDEIAWLAFECIRCRKSGQATTEVEHEIDRRVAELYGLRCDGDALRVIG